MQSNAGTEPREPEYDVVLSFAGEQRPYVQGVAAALRDLGVRVFYDDYERATLWGKDLYEHLDFVYGRAARYCVLFASRDYASKVWTTHERRSAQARALEEHVEYILPARFDDTEIPGLRNTIGYQSLREMEPKELASLVAEKLGPRQRRMYMPPVPDRLFEELGLEDDSDAQDVVSAHAGAFLQVLSRMSPKERKVLLTLFLEGCPAELPDNVHAHVDLLRRVTGLPATEILEVLGGMRSLGIFSEVRLEEHEGEVGRSELVAVEWNNLVADDEITGPATQVAVAMVGLAGIGLCSTHAVAALDSLDFGQLASVTADADVHGEQQPTLEA